MDKVFCELPWTGKNVKLYNDFERCCCKMQFAPKEKDSIRLRSIKDAFIDGEWHPACNACSSEEKVGGQSFRILQKAAVTEQKISFLEQREKQNLANLEYIDLEFGYTCNMYCMSCGPFASTTWQQIAKIFPWEEKGINDDSLNNFLSLIELHKDTLKKINLYGGDPSVDPMYYKFVDRFLSMGFPKVDLGIVTNGNYSENHLIKFEDSLKKLSVDRRVHITFSLDGVGEEGEFIRGGLKMERFTRNIKSAISFGLRPRLQISVSLLNIENNIKIIEWADAEGLLPYIDIHLNKVSFPEDLSVNVLGNRIKDFLPEWFFDLDRKYPKYYKNMVTFLGTDLDEMKDPDFAKINRFLVRLDDYTNITGLALPEYYQNFKKRLLEILPKSVN